MSVATGSKIATDGLCFYFDAANVKSAKSQKSNILSWNDWKSGTSDNITSTGSWPSYWRNGEVGINTRILDTNPFGVTDVIWDVSNQDAASDDDGGWQTSEFTIDTTKTYRFSTWVRRKTIGNGSFYLGPHSNWGAVAGAYILNRSNGAENQNPYFVAGNWWGNANDWYLVVGHVWAAGSGTGSSHPDSGIYTTAGVKLSSATDYMWAPTNTTSFHRTYLYYSTDITTNQQWYQPRVDICDGNEPTIAELLNNIGNKIYDLSGNNLNTSLVNGVSYTSANMGSFGFDGINDAVTLAANSLLATAGSVTMCSTFQKTAGSNGTLYRIQYGNESTYSLLINSTGPFTQWWTTGDTRVTHQCNFTINSNQIYHIAATIVPSGDGLTNTSTFYINGSLTATVSTTDTFPRRGTSGPLWIGSGVSGAGTPIIMLTGNIYNTLFYNRALSDSEIQQNFNAIRGRYGL